MTFAKATVIIIVINLTTVCRNLLNDEGAKLGNICETLVKLGILYVKG